MARMHLATHVILILLTAAAGGAQEPAGNGPGAAPPPAFRLPLTLVDDQHDTSEDRGSLALPARAAATSGAHAASPTAGRAVLTTLTSLAVVIGLFLLLVWLQRRTGAGRGVVLPGEVLETLGRVPLNGRQEMHLVRVGNKLLLLAVTAQGAETLTEITDPHEIDRLSGICRHSRSDSICASFREILAQLGRTPASDGYQCPTGR